MDKTVPAGAALLLDFIAETETGRSDASKYGVVYAHKQDKLPKPITSMTVDEWIAAGRSWTRNHGSSAAGAYQFMNATLKGLKSELRLRGSQVMDPDLQDRLGYHLLLRRGYNDFMAGKLSRGAFAKNLAKEWASFPVLSATQGSKRTLKRGQSYYAGDGLNKALVKPEAVENILTAVRTVPERDFDKPDTAPEPKPSKPLGWGAWGAIGAALLAAILKLFGVY